MYGLEINLAAWPAYFDSKYHVIVLKNLFSIILHSDHQSLKCVCLGQQAAEQNKTRITAGYECDSLKGQQLEPCFPIQQQTLTI